MESFELIKRFWKFNEKERLGSSIVAVYLFLIDMWDENQKADFTISDKQISSVLKVSRKTIKTAKDSLRNLGLLSYKNTNGYPCVYKIITDYEFSTELQTVNKVPKQEKFKFEKPKEAVKSAKKEEKSLKREIQQVSKKVIEKTPANIPSVDEFLAFAKSLEIYDKNSPNIDFKIKTKYESWKENGWKNGHGKAIRNWQTTLKSSLPYMITPTNNSFTGNVPVIKRPKQTYNE